MAMVWQFIKKLNIELLYDPVDSTPRYISKRIKKTYFCRKICTLMFIIALFIIARKWKQPKCPSAKGWKNKRCNSHRAEYYSVIKGMKY